MASRRWLWGLAGAMAALGLAQAVRAQALAAAGTRKSLQPPEGEAAAGPAAATSSRPVGRYAAAAASPLPAHERRARYWLRTAALAAQVETEASRLAATRAESAAVRALAAGLLEQHESGRLELMRLLHAREMAAPLMDTAQRKALDRLARSTGPQFDRHYVELVGSARRRDEWLELGKAAPGLGDPVLQAWIERHLPGLRGQHAAAGRLLPAQRRAAAPGPAADRQPGAR